MSINLINSFKNCRYRRL